MCICVQVFHQLDAGRLFPVDTPVERLERDLKRSVEGSP
jgi:hypothetical protein